MDINTLLEYFREQSRNTTEKGDYFERLTKIFLQNDKTYASQFTEVLSYADWAKSMGLPANDIGIDLVGKNSDDELYTAIQCKFYNADSAIDKKGIDSFIAASGSNDFNRCLFVDTTTRGISTNVEMQLKRHQTDFTRIGLDVLENSSIDWAQYLNNNTVTQKPKNQLRPHQQDALKAVQEGLIEADRGKLIMACGTGKTFTALKIAESIAGEDGCVLFLAPSLALVSQSITEWSKESAVDLHAFAVCSDTKVGKSVSESDDFADISTHDLAYPATTNPKQLADKYGQNHQSKMRVIFATYQSIKVISEAQKNHGLPPFDLIICDEAHRTTGASLSEQDESHFVKVHDQEFINSRKRLYMTATPRVYITKVKQKADESGAQLYSMDDDQKFGKDLYTLKFGDAVEQNLLTDFKVVVLAVDETQVARDIQRRLAESDSSLKIDDGAKIVGCYKALAKIGIEQTEGSQPMRRAVAFCRSIKDSKRFEQEFNNVIEGYLEQQQDNFGDSLKCDIKHLDGTMNTAIRNEGIRWLKEDHGENLCRILTNVRCLSEGVDVPSLDAVLFVHSRKSKVDIVQSVGRVMRKAEGKKLGYVILPIAVQSDVEPEQALNDNKKYAVVWDVLNALRSHDERLDAEINRMEFGGRTDRIEIISEVNDKQYSSTSAVNIGAAEIPQPDYSNQPNMNFEYGTLQRAIRSKIVKKCGQRDYLINWTKDVADIAQKHISSITALLSYPDTPEYRAFQKFHRELQQNINTSITANEVIEMLAQHMITKPVFEALFNHYDFSTNPVSQAMEKILAILEQHNIDNEAGKLEKFYASVKRRVEGIENDDGRQKIIVELYDHFFRDAFPDLTERLGIVYTPIECVDFILHSVNDVLKQQFNQTLADEHTHIIDPFTGTGTFITRLLQSGLIPHDKLAHKFSEELHANEIVLLAYYIASINIETTYNTLINQGKAADERNAYEPFNGICLTDTFQLYEHEENLLTPQLPVNSARLNKQKQLDIKVIIGNPPYSAGQRSANDNNQNTRYEKLDASIKEKYVRNSLQKGNKNALYDSYIRAICWASDRIGENGIIGFITNGGWLGSNSADGMRKTLTEEFSDLYIFHLRGNARTQGELRRKEKDNVFGMGTRTPVAIAILVKNANVSSRGNIHFHDIGDYLNRDEKLKKIRDYSSIESITQQNDWQTIKPDKYHDWLNQRDNSFYEYIPMGDKKTGKTAVFENYSRGLATSRDAWVYNASKTKLEQNIQHTIAFYNQELKRYQQSDKSIEPKDFVTSDSTKIAWNDSVFNAFNKNQLRGFNVQNQIQAVYRPFNKINCYYTKEWNEGMYQMPKIFPEVGLDNLVIGISGKRSSDIPFSSLITDTLPDLEFVSKSQCFPLKLYEPIDIQGNLNISDIITAPSGKQYRVKDGISDAGLEHFSEFYKASISKTDLFFYLYGLLHSTDYRKRFANNLTKDLPHIPRVNKVVDFWTFSQAGRDLAELHLHYEDKTPYPAEFEQGKLAVDMMTGKDFCVKEMRFKSKADKSAIVYNANITLTNLPPEAYNYVVNGRSAIEWVMERQQISTHKDSGIVNNPNDWANETMNNPRYPLDLLLKVITVSLESVKIIENLPSFDF